MQHTDPADAIADILINIGRPICFRIDQARIPIGRGHICLLNNSEHEHSVEELEGADQGVERYGFWVNAHSTDEQANAVISRVSSDSDIDRSRIPGYRYTGTSTW